ncbi:9097_t:CDS:1 [Gigaspora margarita]|uniref:9097_t:CDS:1 n=1 Tax=Gigaspora margarita TaxID=4874 RepID=A0ABN7UE94_GIGMA|nr:9097_t:CDS:1 [Gigaspora margarita]
MNRAQPRRSRSYTSLACTNCQRKHIKCSGKGPCINCKEKSLQCHFISGKKRGPKEKSLGINRFEASQITENHNTKDYFEVTDYSKYSLHNNYNFYNGLNLMQPMQPQNCNDPITNYNSHDLNSFIFNGEPSLMELQQQNGFQEVIYGIFIIPVNVSPNISFNNDCNFENNLITGTCLPNYNSLYSFESSNSSNLFNNQSTTNISIYYQ